MGLKLYRSEMISKQLIRIIQNVLMKSIVIFDEHNFHYGSCLRPEDINIIKVFTHKALHSCTIYYFISTGNINDMNFLIFNKHKIFKQIKKQLKLKYCPKIQFKYDKTYVEDVYPYL